MNTETKQSSEDAIQSRIASILDANDAVLEGFFTGIASCSHYDGLSHQLYLDLYDDKLEEYTEVSDNTWHERRDGSLVLLATEGGFCDIPESERYKIGHDLADYGYGEWLEEISDKITEAIKYGYDGEDDDDEDDEDEQN